MTSTQDEQLREAIRATEYKYFGDYEMSESQRKAVDVLVSHAEASLALKADDRSSMERLGTILRDTNFKPTKKYLGAAFLGYDYARRYYTSLPAPGTAGEVVADEHSALVAAGFDDYAARCALRTEPDGGFCHAYLYSDGQWRFQTGGSELHQPDGKVLQCVLIKRLYAAPQATVTGGDALPDDVRALVIAGRDVWERLTFKVAPDESMVDALDKALEAFSSRVPYDDEPALNPTAAEARQ